MPALWLEPQQRPAGVSRIDRRIGLNGLLDVRPFRAADGAQRTDDAARHRARKSKRVSDGEGFLAHLKVLGIAKYGGNYAGRVNFDNRQVMPAVASDHLRLVGFLVVQSHFHLRGVANHVEVGQDVPFLVDDEAGTLAFLGHGPVEEVVSHSFRGNVDDRRNGFVVDIDIIELVGIEGLGARSLTKFDVRGPGDQGLRRDPAVMGRVPVEGPH